MADWWWELPKAPEKDKELQAKIDERKKSDTSARILILAGILACLALTMLVSLADAPVF